MATLTWTLILASGVQEVTFDHLKVIEIDGENAAYVFQAGGHDVIEVALDDLSDIEFGPRSGTAD